MFFLPISFGPTSNASLAKNVVFYGFNDRRIKCEMVKPFICDATIHDTMVNAFLATTSRKRPPPVSDHVVNNRFVS